MLREVASSTAPTGAGAAIRAAGRCCWEGIFIALARPEGSGLVTGEPTNRPNSELQ